LSEPRPAPGERPFAVADRLRSFRYALRGIATMLRTQHNAWLHAVATLAVAGAALLLGVRREDWPWLILAMLAVWTAEALNTAFEFLCDVASPAFHPRVEQAKDVAAGAVLIAALGAALVGALVFLPYLQRLLGAARP